MKYKSGDKVIIAPPTRKTQKNLPWRKEIVGHTGTVSDSNASSGYYYVKIDDITSLPIHEDDMIRLTPLSKAIYT